MPRTKVGVKEILISGAICRTWEAMAPKSNSGSSASSAGTFTVSTSLPSSSSAILPTASTRALAWESVAISCPTSSFITPSSPIFSSLSRVMKALSCFSSATPAAFISSRRNRRSLSKIVESLSSPSLPIAFHMVTMISTSALKEASPKISISTWLNWRKRPFCGRSARHTGPVWKARNTLGSSAWWLAK